VSRGTVPPNKTRGRAEFAAAMNEMRVPLARATDIHG
jgi:hypothetical protein